jgi:hypothetical protein
MSKWALRASQYLLIGTLFVSLGGHLALLQTMAWGNMLVGFSRVSSLQEAAKKTFDGEHPCPLCKVVKESKKQEDKKSLVKAESKMEVILPSSARIKTPEGVAVVVLVPGYFGRDSEISLGVPLQPPRSV